MSFEILNLIGYRFYQDIQVKIINIEGISDLLKSGIPDLLKSKYFK